MICQEILFSDHAIAQMFKRNISVDNIRSIIESGEVIVTYPNDKPFPSFLTLGYINSRPIHLVIGKDEIAERCVIITAYEPDINIWQVGFKLKKK